MYRPVNHGYIETVIGPMYSGKSEELIRSYMYFLIFVIGV